MTDMREEFEAHARSRGLDTTKLCHGDYRSFSTGEAYIAWQAARTGGEVEFCKWVSELSDRLHDLCLNQEIGDCPSWAEINGLITETTCPAPVAAVPDGWREAIQEFVDRVEAGEVRSKYTYAKFKALLKATPQPAYNRNSDEVLGKDLSVYSTPQPVEESEERPNNCREVLRKQGKPYPKSGCFSCGNGGLSGCPYPQPPEGEQ